jgi:hypothetical protein
LTSGKEDNTAEVTFISYMAKKLNTICPDSGGKRIPPEYCTCDNSPGMKTRPPYDLNDGRMNIVSKSKVSFDNNVFLCEVVEY